MGCQYYWPTRVTCSLVGWSEYDQRFLIYACSWYYFEPYPREGSLCAVYKMGIYEMRR